MIVGQRFSQVRAVAVRTTKFREFAEAAITNVELAAKTTTSQSLGLTSRTQAAQIQITNGLNVKEAMESAMVRSVARSVLW